MSFFSDIGNFFSKLWKWIKDNILIVLLVVILIVCIFFPAIAALAWAWLSTSFAAVFSWAGGVIAGMTGTELLIAGAVAWAAVDPESLANVVGDVGEGIGGAIGSGVGGIADGLGLPSILMWSVVGFVGYKLITGSSEDKPAEAQTDSRDSRQEEFYQ